MRTPDALIRLHRASLALVWAETAFLKDNTEDNFATLVDAMIEKSNAMEACADQLISTAS